MMLRATKNHPDVENLGFDVFQVCAAWQPIFPSLGFIFVISKMKGKMKQIYILKALKKCMLCFCDNDDNDYDDDDNYDGKDIQLYNRLLTP